VTVTHSVPYVSQFASADLVEGFVTDVVPLSTDPRWAETGAADVVQYAWWARRMCGMACLRMVLAARGVTATSLVELAEECARHGGYVRHDDGRVDGLIYAPFARWVCERFRIGVEVRTALPVAEVRSLVNAGTLVMASVHPWLRWPDRTPPARGGHLVLVVGTTPETLLVHNPSGLPGESQEYAEVPTEVFGTFYAERGVLFPPSSLPTAP
jgi:hypothetical protein